MAVARGSIFVESHDFDYIKQWRGSAYNRIQLHATVHYLGLTRELASMDQNHRVQL